MTATRSYATMDTPIGQIHLAGSSAGLAYLGFARPSHAATDGAGGDIGPLAAVIDQLSAYFAGHRRAFDLPLDLALTPFQARVLAAVGNIPYGQTRTYGEIAREIGAPGAARAVGRANHDNPVAIVIPCHRVLGASGRLTGYAGGLDNKAILLELEQTCARAA